MGYRNYYNAALAAAPKKVFLPCVSLPRANFYENIFYNAFALWYNVFMTIYPNMNKEDRNRILQSRYSLLGIPESAAPDGRLLYVSDLEDKMLYYENCENPELKMSIGNALVEMMGDPDGDDSWREIL